MSNGGAAEGAPHAYRAGIILTVYGTTSLVPCPFVLFSCQGVENRLDGKERQTLGGR